MSKYYSQTIGHDISQSSITEFEAISLTSAKIQAVRNEGKGHAHHTIRLVNVDIKQCYERAMTGGKWKYIAHEE